MGKQRFILIPKGKKIDNSAKDWIFPVGTIFIKTFFDDSGPGGKPRPIETRLIRRVGDTGAFTEYDFYLYQWNADGTDANLLLSDMDGMAGDVNKELLVPITIKRTENGQPFSVNNGQPFMHALPSRKDCGDCHEENAKHAQTFIGFDELRLNSKLTSASTKTQLQTFSDAGVFMMPVPAAPLTIKESDPTLLRVKRFVMGNCVHCHYGPPGQFDQHPDVFVMDTVNKPTEAEGIVPPAGWLRVVPGHPEKSVLFVQVQRTNLPPPPKGTGMSGLRAMPPVGVTIADQQAVSDIGAWIMSLPTK